VLNWGLRRYCTGGVRCELASSYLRSKGKEFEDVIQVALDRNLSSSSEGFLVRVFVILPFKD